MYNRAELPQIKLMAIDNYIKTIGMLYESAISTYNDVLDDFKNLLDSKGLALNYYKPIPLDFKHIKSALWLLADEEYTNSTMLECEESVQECKAKKVVPINFNYCKDFIKNMFIFNHPDWSGCPEMTDDFVIAWCYILESKEDDPDEYDSDTDNDSIDYQDYRKQGRYK
jgi:hypothetical protein